MVTVVFRFYAELNDFLSPKRRFITFPHAFDSGTSVKHAVESFGVAHTEVDLILVNGEPVDFSYLLKDGDWVSIYPVFESLDIAPVSPLRPIPLREPRFVLDAHLGKLATYLRMLGFDTLYSNTYADQELAEISSSEKRILLSRDRGLLKRKIVTHGYCIREDNPFAQVVEVMRRFDLYALARPFQRCLRCNGLRRQVSKEEIIDQLQPNTRQFYDTFYQCQSCGQLYWEGSHFERMKRVIDQIMQSSGKNDDL